MTIAPSRILKAAAARAISTVRRHEAGHRRPSAPHPPSRSRKEIKAITNRIGTSFGTRWYTLWPITIAAPTINSASESHLWPFEEAGAGEEIAATLFSTTVSFAGIDGFISIPLWVDGVCYPRLGRARD